MYIVQEFVPHGDLLTYLRRPNVSAVPLYPNLHASWQNTPFARDRTFMLGSQLPPPITSNMFAITKLRSSPRWMP